MKLTLADTKFLKDSISAIADLVTEVRFKVTSNGLELVAMDPANVAMVLFTLLSSSFIEYEVKKDTVIALNLNDLKQVLRRVKPADTLTLENPDAKLKVTLKGKSTRTFQLPLIDIEEREQKVPDLKFNVTVTTAASTINDAIEDVDIIGESVVFSADEKAFTISSSNDLSTAEVELKADDETSIDAKEETRSKYSIEYLKKMIQGAKLADTVTVQFSKDYPLRLDYTVKDKMQLAFILAPRVDND
ncbi:proliferating cell nuclear antigen (pcna) [Candidatus Woesearchaeota archaeon]|nr:MAG: proliferating cell nuclear antigen (pcna) [Candidatus Woesearchaeota archaeon]